MAKIDLVSHLFKTDKYKLTKIEKFLIELKLFDSVYKEFQGIFKYRYQNCQKLIKSHFGSQKEYMFVMNFTHEMIRDILSTEEYSLSGIAAYTHVPEEVLVDIVLDINTNPTFDLLRKIFELHITVKPDFYKKMLHNIVTEYLDSNPSHSVD